MADIEYDQTVIPTTSKSLSIVTMSHSHNETETGLTAPFNQTDTEQLADDYSTTLSLSTFTIAKTHEETETGGLTSSISTAFVSTIVFDVEITPQITDNVAVFDPRGIPIIFHSITSSDPIIFHDRTSAEPIIFHTRGAIQKSHDEEETGFTCSFNRSPENIEKRPISTFTTAIVAMDQTHDEAESGCVAAFSTAVA